MNRPRRLSFLLLASVLLLSILLNFLLLYKEGFSNLYYAAAVKSMLTSFRNFFFVSFDPAGFVSVDKPPLGLWIQALFVFLLGLNGISLILPQAISGVLSVAVMYVLIKDIFDERAGLIAAFVLATTPAFVAVSRNNTMDMQLVLAITLASLTFFKAIRRKSVLYLIITFALIGLGFNVKMLLAFSTLLAIGTVWFMSTHTDLKKRFTQITAAGVVLAAVSFSWISIVELYPKSERPYVGSTENNSAFELAFSYNGLARTTKQPLAPSIRNLSSIGPGAPRVNWEESGRPGILRLFNKELAGQISWFLPFVLLGLPFLLLKRSEKLGTDTKRLSILYWLLWLLPYALYLSFSTGVIHRHYVVVLAPPIAALCGILSVQLWDSYKSNGKSRFLLPAAVFLAGLFQFIIVNKYCIVPKIFLRIPGYSALVILITVTVLSFLLVLKKLSVGLDKRIPGIALYIPVLVALSAAPFYWVCTPLIYGGNYALPYAAPDLYTDSVKGWRFVKDDQVGQIESSCVNPMHDFLMQNRTNEQFLVAVPSSYATAALLMLYDRNMNIPVMTIGGFTGTDPILSVESLTRYVQEGKVRFFLVPSYLENPESKSLLIAPGNNDQIYKWVIDHGRKVEKELWNTGLVTFPIPDPMSLYDVKG